MTVTCSDQTYVYEPCPQPLVLTGLRDGNHRVTIRVADRAGNATVYDRYWIVDTTGPSVDLPAPGSFFGDSAELAFTTDADAVAIGCAVDGGPPIDCAPPAFRSTGVAPGSHTLLITATDASATSGRRPAGAGISWRPRARPCPAGARARADAARDPGRGVRAAESAVDRLRRDARAAVRRLARRGPRLGQVRSVTFRSTLPLAGRLSASLRANGRTVATGHATLTRAGAFSVKLRTTAAGRRRLRRRGARLELRISHRPAGGRVVSVRASARSARR